MTEAEILQAIRGTGFAQIVRDSTWLFGLGEMLHFLGLCLLLGAMLIVDLRLMGLSPGIPLRAALAFLPVAVAGFALNLATGLVFFVADPFLYWPNPAFRLKLVLIFVAGVNALAFAFLLRHREAGLERDGRPHLGTKIAAGLSLCLWLGVIVLGRLLTIFES